MIKIDLQAELAKVPEQLRGFTAAAIQLELELAAGVDVTIGEAALRARNGHPTKMVRVGWRHGPGVSNSRAGVPVECGKREQLARAIATAINKLSLEAAFGNRPDFELAEVAVRALESASSIALEHQVHIERTALRMILKAIAAAT